MKANRTRRTFTTAGAAALAVALAAAFALPERQAHAQAMKPVVLRFVADFPPPPHPAGLAMQYFKDRLPQVIPGSEARLYFAGALYTIPEAFEAMRQGNLELTWMQMGKAAPVDPYMMSVVGPGILTTVGAVDNLDQACTPTARGRREKGGTPSRSVRISTWPPVCRVLVASCRLPRLRRRVHPRRHRRRRSEGGQGEKRRQRPRDRSPLHLIHDPVTPWPRTFSRRTKSMRC